MKAFPRPFIRWTFRLSVLCLAVMLALPWAAFADNVVNDVTAGGTDTFTLGGSTTVNYWIVATNGDGQTGCNANDGSAAIVTINTPAAVSATPTTLTFSACGATAAQSVVFAASAAGDYEITASVSDSGTGTYNTNPAKFTLHVLASTNTLPTVTANDQAFYEGTSTSYTASWSDPDAGQSHTCTIDFGDGAGPQPATVPETQPSTSGTCTASHTYADGPNSYTITVNVSDGTGSGSDTATATVNNVPPVITGITPSYGALYDVNTPVNVTAVFTDAGTLDTHSCTINWDDGNTTSGAVSEANGSGTCTASRAYSGAGVYTIQVTVTDDDGGSDAVTVMVVVYDPSAGFVTGGGWINSPAGAYTPENPNDPDLTGRANFGFVSKYKKGATTPTGQTEFQFQVANFNFHSDAYQWLVVAGAKAQYKGTGTVNGAAGYGFLLTATDGQISGGGGADKLRIKIWEIGGAIVYDNAYGASEDIDSANPQTIAGGSIVIHSK